jgi:hypothetical protein
MIFVLVRRERKVRHLLFIVHVCHVFVVVSLVSVLLVGTLKSSYR